MGPNEPLEPSELAERLVPLLSRGSSDIAAIGVPAATLRTLGFEVREGRVHLPAGVERLDETQIRRSLGERARRWLSDFAILEVVGSTSSLLNEAVAVRSINGMVRMAELQVGGRGRRGRSWVSPYANNLALSIGARLPQTPDQLGGFSLCVGLAVADRLQTLGVPGVSLKWPNDVLVNARKIAGILVELHRADAGCEVVIGVGVNFRIPADARSEIDQPITDLAEAGQQLSRNQVASGLISSLVDYVEAFSSGGFAPMSAAFDSLHYFHRQPCTLLLGSESVSGVVEGVSDRGELLVRIRGEVRPFSAGEVSLRPV